MAIIQSTMQVNILDAKNRLSQLIKTAQSGQEVVIANRGQPVARLVAVTQVAQALQRDGIQPPRAPGGLLQWLHDHPLPPHAQRSHAAIEAGIEAERASWD